MSYHQLTSFIILSLICLSVKASSICLHEKSLEERINTADNIYLAIVENIHRDTNFGYYSPRLQIELRVTQTIDGNPVQLITAVGYSRLWPDYSSHDLPFVYSYYLGDEYLIFQQAGQIVTLWHCQDSMPLDK